MNKKLVKKTAQYSIYRRGDQRYAVKDANSRPVNGEDKVRILLAEELIKTDLPKRSIAEPSVEEISTVEAQPAVQEADASAQDES